MNYIIYVKACARTADLVLVIGTSLSGLASDCVPEVGRRHDSECCFVVVVLLLLYCCCCCTLLFFFVLLVVGGGSEYCSFVVVHT